MNSVDDEQSTLHEKLVASNAPVPTESTSLVSNISNNNILLSDTSRTIRYKGYKVNIYLTNQVFQIFYISNNNKAINGKLAYEINLSDVIGTNITQLHRKIELVIYRYVTQKSFYSCYGSNGESSEQNTLRKASHIKLYFDKESEKLAISWSNAINTAAYGKALVSGDGNDILPIPRKRILVFINPVSGKGTAKKAWDKEVSRMFSEASVETLLYVTKHQNDAYEFVANVDYNKYDMIAILSGDGLIFEVINGISSRADSEAMFNTIPIAVLPGGTANGLVKSILHHSGIDYSLTNSVFNVLKGSPHPLDLSTVKTVTKTYKSFLSLSWGFISDIDILSESMRYLGETRLYLAAVYFICTKRLYRGRLSMLLVDENNNPSDKMHVIETDFVGVWVLQTSHSASTVHSGPGVRLNDGLFTILVITSQISRCSLLSLLLTIDAGQHIHNPNIQVYKATAYKLEPLTDKGMYSLDGELIDYGPLEGVVEPAIARVIAM